MKIKPKKKIGSGFSLLEMLAVLFLIGILISISVPTIGQMMRTAKLKTATDNLANTLETARQYAMTRGRNSYVVFPTQGTYPYRCYKIFDSYSNSNPNCNGESPLGKLEVLPTGIEIDSASTFMGGAISVNAPEVSGSLVSARYVSFKSTGAGKQNGSVKIDDTSAGVYQTISVSVFPKMVNVSEIQE